MADPITTGMMGNAAGVANKALQGAGTGSASLFSPDSGSAQQPPQNLQPGQGGGVHALLQQNLDHQKWLVNRLTEPTTRLDISGRPVDPNAPSDFDQARANQGPHSWQQPTNNTSSSYAGPQAAAAENAMHSQGIENGMTPYGTASVSHTTPGQVPGASTMFGEPTDRYLTEQSIASKNNNARENYTSDAERAQKGLPPIISEAQQIGNLDNNQQDLLRGDKGYQLPPGPQTETLPMEHLPIQQRTNIPDALGNAISKVNSGTSGFFENAGSKPVPLQTRLHATVKPEVAPTTGTASHFSNSANQPGMREVYPGTGILKANGLLPSIGTEAGDLGTSAYDSLMKVLFGDNPHANDRFRKNLGPMKPAIQ